MQRPILSAVTSSVRPRLAPSLVSPQGVVEEPPNEGVLATGLLPATVTDPPAEMVSDTAPTIELCRHHPSGGFLATFANVRAIGTTRLEALGQLIVNDAFGEIRIADCA